VVARTDDEETRPNGGNGGPLLAESGEQLSAVKEQTGGGRFSVRIRTDTGIPQHMRCGNTGRTVFGIYSIKRSRRDPSRSDHAATRGSDAPVSVIEKQRGRKRKARVVLQWGSGAELS